MPHIYDPKSDPLQPIAMAEEGRVLRLLDQRVLPEEVRFEDIRTAVDTRDAIRDMTVRGAPNIGLTAALGLLAAARNAADLSLESFLEDCALVREARPTAVDLHHVCDRMAAAAKAGGQLMRSLEDCAEAVHRECAEASRRIGEYGLGLIKPGAGIMTHCNAGRLAAIDYGTATAPMYMAAAAGVPMSIYCCETRPRLQGAKLTAFELSRAGLEPTLICDSAAAGLMARGSVDIIFVGCDRAAANGDVANKLGTLTHAIAAARYGIPFYVCAPYSSIDADCPTGADIVIEERSPLEVAAPFSPELAFGPKIWNPAFDVTDHRLITGIITEKGIAYPPFEISLRELAGA